MSLYVKTLSRYRAKQQNTNQNVSKATIKFLDEQETLRHDNFVQYDYINVSFMKNTDHSIDNEHWNNFVIKQETYKLS